MSIEQLKLVRGTLEDHAPGWSRRLLSIRREMRRYQGEMADIRMTLKELSIQEQRLLKSVEAIADALEADDAGLLDQAVEGYREA
jgi:hypothetical protein